jgi:hypothetical protein
MFFRPKGHFLELYSRDGVIITLWTIYFTIGHTYDLNILAHIWKLQFTSFRTRVWHKVGYGGEGCYLHGLWLVLESAKDRFRRVDTIGQHVSPYVWCGTSYWLIRKALGRCLVRCVGLVWLYLRDHMVQEGAYGVTTPGGNLSVKGAWGYRYT